MTRSRFSLAEGSALLGVCFGAWLIHYAFQPASELPNPVLVWLGGVDIFLCCGLLGSMLRVRLQDGERLPRGWIIAGAIFIAGFLGWITALLLDAERVRKELALHRQADQHLVQLEEAIHQFQQIIPLAGLPLDRGRWDSVQERFGRESDLLSPTLHSKPEWQKHLSQATSLVLQAQQQSTGTDMRLRTESAQQEIEKVRSEISHGDQDLNAVHRARWQSIGSSALTGVFLLIGSVLFCLVLDRELRRSRKAKSRLETSETHFRSLVENQAHPVAVLDEAGAIRYASPAWQKTFQYSPADLEGRNLLELIHPADRAQAQAAIEKQDLEHPIRCRLSADYGVSHDVELHCQEHAHEGRLAIRVHNLRETGERADAPEEPAILKLPGLLHAHEIPALVYTYEPATRRFTSVSNLPAQALGYGQVPAASTPEFFQSLLHPEDESRVFRALASKGGTHEELAQEDEIRLRDSDGQYRWYKVTQRVLPPSHDAAYKVAGVAFPIDREKRAEEARASAEQKLHELSKTIREQDEHRKAHASSLRDLEHHRTHLTKTLGEREDQFKDLEKELRKREHHQRKLEEDLRKREDRCREMEHQVREHERQRGELEGSLQDHQDRLHDLHQSHERHASSLHASKEAIRRLASGVANDFNKILSVVLGYTDVLRESFPKDHMAQSYVDEMRQAASHGAELTQKLLAFSRNHLLQPVPMELHHHLASLEAKIQEAAGPRIKVEWDHANEDLWIKTDPHPLEQALLHLVDHAVHRLTNGGAIAIRTRRVTLAKNELTHADMLPGSYVQLRLEDHGSVIDEETRQHLFEPYYQTKEGHKNDLGLATANGIIRQSGGCIDVETVPGKGSEVIINLPWTDERPHAAAVA